MSNNNITSMSGYPQRLGTGQITKGFSLFYELLPQGREAFEKAELHYDFLDPRGVVHTEVGDGWM
jgi:hypothetical protein